jgi:dihydroorotase
MNAEAAFLKHLEILHTAFPRLKIVLEHATTKAAVDMVSRLGPTVGCTITVHHLALIVDDWAGQVHHFCKPVAKYPSDREALRAVVKSRNPKFFLGTDSAPHPRHLKETSLCAAGVFTGNLVLPYLASVLDSFGALDALVPFACEFGRQFYGLEVDSTPKFILERKPMDVPAEVSFTDDAGEKRAVVPFMAGKTIPFSFRSIA